MVYVNRRLLGQQRDKLYREALRMELAAAGEDLKKLREIARTHIEKAAAGDMQAIKELADRLDGKPIPIADHELSQEGESVLKIVREIVHVNKTPEEIAADGEPMLIEWRGVRDANGSGVLNEDTARTKR
jgi:hypothetical protein